MLSLSNHLRIVFVTFEFLKYQIPNNRTAVSGSRFFTKQISMKKKEIARSLNKIRTNLIPQKLKDVKLADSAVASRVLWFLSVGRNAIVVLISSVISFYLHQAGQTPFVLSGRLHTYTREASTLLYRVRIQRARVYSVIIYTHAVVLYERENFSLLHMCAAGAS